MSTPVHAIDASADVQDAADKMSNLNISRLLVTEGGRPVGMFSAKLLSKNLRFLRPQKAIDQYLDDRVASVYSNR